MDGGGEREVEDVLSSELLIARASWLHPLNRVP